MPVVTCPKCPTKLRVAEGATGNVRCPKCGNVFPLAPTAAIPAFEVVDEPASPPPPPRPAASPPPPPAASPFSFDAAAGKGKKRANEDEEEDAPPPKSKGKSGGDFEFDDDEDERPRSKKKRRDDDDEDDDRGRGRGRRRRDDDDEDDDRDRPRSKRRGGRRDDPDDDEDYDRRPSGGGNAFGAAKTGTQLVGISLWLYGGTFALLLFFLLLAFVGLSIPNGLMIVVGLLGLTNWVVGLIGLGFCIAGPPKARGLAIAATAVAAVHLILAFVVANNDDAMRFPTNVVQAVSAANKAEKMMALFKKLENEKDPKRREDLMKEMRDMSEETREAMSEIDDEPRSGRRGGSGMRWAELGSLLPYSDHLIGVLAYKSKQFEYYILPFLAGATEVALLILTVLLLGAIARASKNHGTADKSTTAAVVVAATVGVATLVLLVLQIVDDSNSKSKPTSMEAAEKAMKRGMTYVTLGFLVVYLCHAAAVVLPSFLAMETSRGCRRRA